MAQDIRTKLILDNRDFNRGIDDSEKKSKSFGTALSKIGGIATTAAKALGVAATAVQALAIRQASLGAQLQDTADKLGVQVGFLQEFRFAAQQSGVATNTTDMALQRFTRRVAEAAKGTGEAKDALRAMGIQLRDNNGTIRSAESLMADIADAFANTESESERVRLAFKLFDSEGVSLVNTLSQGSGALSDFARDAQRLGAVLTREQTEILKDLDDSYTELQAAIKGVVNEFVVGLASALEDTNTEMADLLANNKELAGALGEGVGESLKTIAAGFEVVINNIELFRLAMTTASASFFFIAASNFLSLIAKIGAVLVGAGASTKVFSSGVKGLLLRLTGLNPILSVITGLLFTFKDTAFELGENTTSLSEIFSASFNKIRREIEQASTNFKELFLLIDNEAEESGTSISDSFKSAMDKVRFFVRDAVNYTIGSFVGLYMSSAQIFQTLGEEIKAIFTDQEVGASFAQLGENIKAEFEKALGTDYIRIGERLVIDIADGVVNEQRYLERVMTKAALQVGDMFMFMLGRNDYGEMVFDQLSDMFMFVGKMAEDLPLSPLQQFFEDFKVGVSEGVKTFQNSVKSTSEVTQQAFKMLTDGMTESLTNFVMTGKMSMKGFLQDILRMIVQSGIQNALSGIFTAIGSTDGFFGSLFSGGNALGGMIPAGQFGLVGERGPEFIGGPAQITPIRQSDMGGGGSQQVTYNINAVDASSFRDLVAQDPEFIHAVASTGARRLPR